MKNKEYALKLLKPQINGEIIISYSEIGRFSGCSKRQIIRFKDDIENKDIASMLIHSNIGRPSHNSVANSEIEYLKQFKKQYPNISIAQFIDIYHEDVIFNPNKLGNLTKINQILFLIDFHIISVLLVRTDTFFGAGNRNRTGTGV